MQPSGVHETSARSFATRRPALIGCRPSTSFSGSIASATRAASMPAGSGSCTRKPCTRGSRFSSLDDAQHLGFRRRRGQADLARLDAARARAAALVAHVDLRRGILTDEHDGQARRSAAQLGDALAHVGQDLLGELLAARDSRHVPGLAAEPPDGFESDFAAGFASGFASGFDSAVGCRLGSIPTCRLRLRRRRSPLLRARLRAAVAVRVPAAALQDERARRDQRALERHLRRVSAGRQRFDVAVVRSYSYVGICRFS